MNGDALHPADVEVRRELEQHLDEEVDRLVAAGWSREAARVHVRERAGPLQPIEEACVRFDRQRRRRERRGRRVGAIWQDVRYGFRALHRSRRYAIAAIAMIALGLGPATALYSVVDAILIRGLPYPAPEEIVRIGSTFPGGSIGPVPGPMFRDWEGEGAGPYRSIAATMVENVEFQSDDGSPARLSAGTVSSGLGPLFGLRTEVGRWFSADDDQPGAPPVTVLSHALWTERWGADPEVVGRDVTIDGRPVTVVGVIASDFLPPEGIGLDGLDLWVPLSQAKGPVDLHDNWFLRVVARLPGEASADGALADLQGRTEQLIEGYPLEAYEDVNFTVQTAGLHELTVGSAKETLTPFIAAVALLLLIASVNLANLNLARGSERRVELGVRSALGAARSRIVGQLVVEGAVTGALGLAAATAFAAITLSLLKAVGAANLPRLDEVALDLRVLAAAGALLTVSAVGFSLVPALVATRGASGSIAGGRGAASRVTPRAGRALVSLQLAFALVLLVGAGLLGASYWSLVRVDPGFRTDDVSVLHVQLRDRYAEREERLAAYDAIREELRRVPGVVRVGRANGLPFGNTGVGGTVLVEGRSTEGGPDFVRWGSTDPDYYPILGLSPLALGGVPGVARYEAAEHFTIVNEAFVRAYLEDRDPIGARIKVGGTSEEDPWWVVTGVMKDIKQGRLDRVTSPELYIGLQAAPFVFPTVEFVVQTDPAIGVGPNQLRQAVWAFDPNQPVAWVSSLRDRVAGSTVTPRFHAMLLGALAFTALALAIAGVFGTVAYAVGGRRRELAIRRALGATQRSVQAQVTREYVGWILLGLVGGMLGVYPLSRTLESMLFSVQPMSPLVLVPAALVLAGMAVLGSYLPARAASRADPVVALVE